MENDGLISSVPPEQPAKKGEGCLGELSWLGMSLTLPIVNLNFYRKAISRKISSALLVFFIFALLISILTTATLFFGMQITNLAIRQAYEKGVVPTVVIENGLASVDAPQPFYLVDQDDMLIAFDTTGEISEIDTDKYRLGILLTRDEIQTLNQNGRFQKFKLIEFQRAFGQDPMVFDQASVQNLWQMFSVMFVLFGFLGLAFWNMLVRLGYLAALALLLWPVAGLIRSGVKYSTVFGIGAYVLIPAMILYSLFDRSGVQFFSLQTVLLVPLWALVLWWALRKPEDTAEITLCPCEMLLPLPLLVLYVVDRFIHIPHGDLILWSVAALTLLGAIIVGVLRAKERKSIAPPPPESAQ